MELNGARERVGLPPLDARARRDLARAGARGDVPPARVPAHESLAVGARDRAAAVGAAVRRRRAAAGRRPARAGGAEHLPGPRAPAACAPRWRGWRTSRVRVLATTNRREPSDADARAGQRPARGLGLLRPHDAALRRGGLPRRPRDGRAGAGVRRAGGGLPARGRHGRERRPRPLGRRWRVAAAPLPYARAACGWRCGGCWPSRATRAEPRAGPLGGAQRRRRPAADAVEGLASRGMSPQRAG